MPKATGSDGALQELVKCRIITPYGTIRLKILPEISDSKTANYQNETVAGRSSPVTTYSHSEPRTISSELTFMVTKCQDICDNLTYLRLIESLVYPNDGVGMLPYTPPPVCKFICGKLLGDGGVCVILKSYSVKFPTDVAWDVETYLPYRFTVSCQWEVVYACRDLPSGNNIRQITCNWPCPPGKVDQAGYTDIFGGP